MDLNGNDIFDFAIKLRKKKKRLIYLSDWFCKRNLKEKLLRGSNASKSPVK